MAKILVKSSNTATDTPSTSQATTAELCINTRDRKLYAGTDTGGSSSPGATSGQVSWIGAYIDNGNLSTGSADRLATQQAIKTYVDAQNHSGQANQTLTTGTGISGADGGSSGNFTMAIGQAVGTSDNVSFGNVTASGAVKGTYFSHPTTNSNTVIKGNNTGIDVDIQDSSGNSIAFFEASNKYVGINKTSPGAFLHIDCGAVYDKGLKVSHTGVTDIDIYTDGGSRAHFKHNQNNIAMQNSGYTAFTCANAERMRISAGGGLGIGTTDIDYKLDVHGDIRLTNKIYAFEDDTSRVYNREWMYFGGGHPSYKTGADDKYHEFKNYSGTNILRIGGSSNAVIATAGITCTTLDTGQGANELYDMNQNVKTDSNVEFADGTFTGDLLCESGLQSDANITCASGDIISIGDFDSGNGSGAAPSHTFTNDKDTGMYRIGANQLGFATNGAKRLSISNSSMEITNDLTVKASSGASDVTIQAPSSGNANLFLLSNNASNNQDKFKIQADPTGYLKFYYNTGSYVEGASLKSNGAFSFANSTQFPAGFSVTGGTAYVGGTSIRNGSIINAGTVGTAYLGSGTANSSTFLRGDGSWASTGGGSDIYIMGYTDLRGNSTAKFIGLVGGSGTTSTNLGSQMAAGCNFIAPVAGNLDSVRIVVETSWGSSCSIKVYVNNSLVRSITQSLTSTGSGNDYNVTLDADAAAGDTVTVKVDPSSSSPQAASWTFKYTPD